MMSRKERSHGTTLAAELCPRPAVCPPAFTLIELLVVIAVIALLMSILMPALNMAREGGRKMVCGQNEKNMGLGLFVYASDNDGKLPLNTVDRWLVDVSYYTADVIMQSKAFDRHIFYCPSWKQRDNIIWWRYGEGLPYGTLESYDVAEPKTDAMRKQIHRAIGYSWLLDIEGGRKKKPMNPDGPTKEWVSNVAKTKSAPASVEMIADFTASDGPDANKANFSTATGGTWERWQIYDRSNHLRSGSKATGGNILFVDGHIEWRKFDDMKHRWFYERYGNPCFWW